MCQGADEPQESTGEDDPDGVLHPLDVAVSVGILANVQLQQMLAPPNPDPAPTTTKETRTLPTRPKRAIQRMKRIKFHTQTRANRRMKGIKKRTAVSADRPPTTTA
jgi:hypothetical protein